MPIGERLFITGPNANGKSNLLDVFRFLRDIAKDGGGLQQAVKERGGLSKIRCLAARRYPDVEIEVTLAESVEASPAKEPVGKAGRAATAGRQRRAACLQRVGHLRWAA